MPSFSLHLSLIAAAILSQQGPTPELCSIASNKDSYMKIEPIHCQVDIKNLLDKPIFIPDMTLNHNLDANLSVFFLGNDIIHIQSSHAAKKSMLLEYSEKLAINSRCLSLKPNEAKTIKVYANLLYDFSVNGSYELQTKIPYGLSELQATSKDDQMWMQSKTRINITNEIFSVNP